jgi:hypothetical protein
MGNSQGCIIPTGCCKENAAEVLTVAKLQKLQEERAELSRRHERKVSQKRAPLTPEVPTPTRKSSRGESSMPGLCIDTSSCSLSPRSRGVEGLGSPHLTPAAQMLVHAALGRPVLQVQRRNPSPRRTKPSLSPTPRRISPLAAAKPPRTTST